MLYDGHTMATPARQDTPRAPFASEPEARTHRAPRVAKPLILSPQQAWEMYDAEARDLLGLSADEFEKLCESGEIGGRIEEPHVLEVWMIRAPKPG